MYNFITEIEFETFRGLNARRVFIRLTALEWSDGWNV